MNHRIFETYFERRLRDNPYKGEVIELLKSTFAKKGMDGGVDATSDRSLEDHIKDIDVIPYRISTMTCIYHFGLELDEYKLHGIAEDILVKSKELYDEGKSDYRVVGMECFDKPIVGEQIKKKRGKLSTRKFRNQLTMIVWSRVSNKHIKIKMFRTGKAQMTGVQSEEDGQGCVKYLVNLLNTNRLILGLSGEVKWDDSKWDIAMMNGDFDVGRKISREYLHTIVCPQYGVVSNLDADTYPGVIMKHLVGTKQITVSVFSSGKVIITGANAKDQIESCVRLVVFLCSKLF